MSTERSYNSSLEHLYDELEWLDLHIERAVQHARTARRAFSESFISDQAVNDLIAGNDAQEVTPVDSEGFGRIDEKRRAIGARVLRSVNAGVELRLPRLAS